MEREDPTLGRIGAYRIVRRLATGGTSDLLVAKAEGPHGFERSVVLKRLLTEHQTDPDFSRMFAREAAAYARLSHPAIVKLYDFFEHEGQLVMVLEYVDGVSLARLLNQRAQEGRPLGDAAAMWVASRIFDALSAAHAARQPDTGEFSPVVHRDVNPSNVLCPWDGHVKLTDFGIAKVAGFDAETKTGVLKGTYGYMAPEQVRGERVTIRADVYCAALVLWELLAHRRAFPSERRPEMEILRSMAEPQLAPLDQLRPDLPPALREAVGRALHPVADRRRVTAEEMVGVLRNATSMEGGRLALVDALRSLRPSARDALAVTSAEDISELDLDDDHTIADDGPLAHRHPQHSGLPTAEVEYVRPTTLPLGTPRPERAVARTMPSASHALAGVAPPRSTVPLRPATPSRPLPRFDGPAVPTRTARGLGEHSAVTAIAPSPAPQEVAPRSSRPPPPRVTAPEDLLDTQIRAPEVASPRPPPALPPAPQPLAAMPPRPHEPSLPYAPTPMAPTPLSSPPPPHPAFGQPPREAPAVVLQPPQMPSRPPPTYQPLPVRPASSGGGLVAIGLAVVAVFLLAGGGVLGYALLRPRVHADPAPTSAPTPPRSASAPLVSHPPSPPTVAPTASAVASAPTVTPTATATASAVAGVAPPAASSAVPAPVAPAVSDKEGVLQLPARAAGHRVYVDGKVAGHGADPLTVPCGKRVVKVGSSDAERTVDVPCGGSIAVP